MVTTTKRNYPNHRVLERAATFDEEIVGYWQTLFGEEDQELAPYFRRLMIRLYLSHRQGRTMYMMDACRFIPVRHAASAKKYVNLAKERGWVTFVEDTKDKRRVIVRPSEILVDLVEQHLLQTVHVVHAADVAMNALQSVGS